MAKITFTQLESLATESVNLSSIVPIVQDGENYKIALSSIDNSDPNWDSTYTSVQTNSASWGIDTVYDDSLLQSTSATWDNTSSVVQSNSASWAVDTDTIYDDSLLQSTSGNWNSSYTTVNANSASWDAHTDPYDDSLLQATSGNWDLTYTTVSANSASWGIDTDTIYDDTHVTTLQAASAEWDDTSSVVQTNSATNWDNTANTLDSVTTNGATTLNDISAGRIATLHPSNPLNHNTATGNSSASVGGIGNVASGNRTGTFGGRINQANGVESSTFGGTNQIVRGNESEGFGGTNVTLNTKFTNTVGGADHVVGLATSPAADPVAKHSLTLGGEASIIENAIQSAIVGGDTNKIQTGHDRSVILGGQNIITDAADTAYAPNLNVGAGFKMPTGAVDAYVLTSDANGVGTWQAAAGGPAGPSGTVLSGTTANATPTEIFVDGTPTNRVDVATGSTITFSALVAARSATESAGYKIEGVIKNDAGTAALVGVVAKTVFAEEDIAWDITVTAANNALTFIVTGDSADSVSWEVTLNKTEAT